MKEVLKKWWFIILLIVIVSIAIVIFLKNKTSNEGVGTAGISEEEFDEIVVGETTNFELNNIIDNNNEWSNDDTYDKCVEKISESKEEHKYTYVYKYYGEKQGYAIITTQADYSNGNLYNDVIVIKKEKINLK